MEQRKFCEYEIMAFKLILIKGLFILCIDIAGVMKRVVNHQASMW